MRKSLLSSVAESARVEPAADAAAEVSERAEPSRTQRKKTKTNSRAGLKHIGAYLDDDAVEKVAILRARLKLDNSQLVKLAIEELYARRRAEGAFRR